MISRKGISRKSLMLVLTVVLLAWALPNAHGQDKYPSRPIDFICNWGVGGGADQMSRLLSPLVQKALGVPFPVSNVPGAGGNAGLAKVLSGRNDGYTIGTFTNYTTVAWAMGAESYKIEDFEWVVRLMSVPSYIFVTKESPIKNGQDFVKAAKQRELKIATAGYNTLDDLGVRMLIKKGLKLVGVVFSKPTERYTAPLGGHVDVLLEETGDVRQFIDAGQLRPIICLEKNRNRLWPDVPTMTELGYAVSIPPNFRAIITKAGVPPERLKILADAFHKAMNQPEWKKFSDKNECSPDSYMGPKEFGPWITSSYQELKEMVKETGVKIK